MKKKYIFVLLISLFMGIVGVDAAVTTVKCGAINDIPAALPTISRAVVKVIKIIVPILIIILGLLDFAKAVIAGEEKNMKEYSQKFIRRIIAGIAIFFVVAIVQFVFRNISSNRNNTLMCINCFINDSSSCTIYEDGNQRKQCTQYGFEGCPQEDDFGKPCVRTEKSNGSRVCTYK